MNDSVPKVKKIKRSPNPYMYKDNISLFDIKWVEVRDIILEERGILGRVLSRLKNKYSKEINRLWLDNQIKAKRALQMALADAIEMNYDEMEAQIWEGVYRGDKEMISLAVKYKGAERGWNSFKQDDVNAKNVTFNVINYSDKDFQQKLTNKMKETKRILNKVEDGEIVTQKDLDTLVKTLPKPRGTNKGSKMNRESQNNKDQL